MYKVQLEIELYFVPPMDEHDPGVSLVKTIELPFQPVPEMGLVGDSLEGNPFPPGLVIKELSWDVDRRLFLAKLADYHFGGDSLSGQAYTLREWIEHGWTLGHLQDPYEQEHEDEEPPDVTPAQLLKSLPLEEPPPRITSPSDRAEGFRACLRGMVRLMAEIENNMAVAYAMDKTGCVLTKSNRDKVSPLIQQRWDDAVKDFENVTYKRRAVWIRRTKKYMPLHEVPDAFDLEFE